MPVQYPLDYVQTVQYCLCMARPHLTEEGYLENFWNAVEKTDGCWIWQRSKLHYGHGQFFYKGKRVQAHRFSWQIHNGEIPQNTMICHRCNNPSCVRPDHLYAGNSKTNGADKAAAGSHRGVKNAACKLTEGQVHRIRELLSRRVTYAEIAKDYNISIATVNAIVTKRIWGWL